MTRARSSMLSSYPPAQQLVPWWVVVVPWGTAWLGVSFVMASIVYHSTFQIFRCLHTSWPRHYNFHWRNSRQSREILSQRQLRRPSAGERTGTDKTKHFFVLPALPRGDPDGFAREHQNVTPSPFFPFLNCSKCYSYLFFLNIVFFGVCISSFQI